MMVVLSNEPPPSVCVCVCVCVHVTCSVDKVSHITTHIYMSMEKPYVSVYTIGQYNPSI